MKTPTLVLFALSACTQTPTDSPPSKPPSTTTTLGRSVTEIDPRIWSIHQTRNGDYWFGSNGNGVYRFDGADVTHYTRADGLSGDAVRGLYEDAKGNVLIAMNSGVSKFDGQRFTTLEFVAEPTPLKDWVLDPDDLWLIKPGVRGPVRYDGEKLYHMQLTESPADAAHHQQPQASFRFDPKGVYSTYKDRRGHLWFGTANVGLCRYDGQTLGWMFEDPLTTTPSGGAFGIRSIFEDRAGHFWICNTRNRFEMSHEVSQEGRHTLLKYVAKQGLPDASSDTDENFLFYQSMIEDDAGALWMACGSDGVTKYSGEHVTRYAIADGAYACCIYRDLKGKLWVSTIEHGIYLLDGVSFEPFQPPKAQRARSTGPK